MPRYSPPTPEIRHPCCQNTPQDNPTMNSHSPRKLAPVEPDVTAVPSPAQESPAKVTTYSEVPSPSSPASESLNPSSSSPPSITTSSTPPICSAPSLSYSSPSFTVPSPPQPDCQKSSAPCTAVTPALPTWERPPMSPQPPESTPSRPRRERRPNPLFSSEDWDLSRE